MNTPPDTFEMVTPDWTATYRRVIDPSPVWAYPVGSTKFPVGQWYAASIHDLTGTLRQPVGVPRRHSGIDLNVQVWPRGGIDEGEPVTAVCSGVVTSRGYSPQPAPGRGWLACVVIRIEQAGEPLWVRYAHLLDASITVRVGDAVTVGQVLGVLDDYRNSSGYNAAHLHFDMARDPFEWNYWLSTSVEWVDPVPILRAELDPDIVDAMLSAT